MPADAPGTAELDSLYVIEDVAGTGVGLSLVDAARDAARGMGRARLALWVREENGRARRFYEKCGLRPTGDERRRPHPQHRFEIHEIRYATTASRT